MKFHTLAYSLLLPPALSTPPPPLFPPSPPPPTLSPPNPMLPNPPSKHSYQAHSSALHRHEAARTLNSPPSTLNGLMSDHATLRSHLMGHPVSSPDLIAACEARLTRMATLPPHHTLPLAYDLTVSDRAALPPTCHLETLHSTIAELTTVVSMMTNTIHNQEQSMMNSAKQWITMQDGVRRNVRAYGTRMHERSNALVPVHGYTIDGVFSLLDSTIRCYSNREYEGEGVMCHTGWGEKVFESLEMADLYALNALNDAMMDTPSVNPDVRRELEINEDGSDGVTGLHTGYVLGTKTMAVVAVCYDGLNCSSHDSAYELSPENEAAGGFLWHLDSVMNRVKNYYVDQSWGQMDIDYKVVDKLFVLPAEYGIDRTNCLQYNHYSAMFLGQEEVLDDAGNVLQEGIPSLRDALKADNAEDQFVEDADFVGVIWPNCFEGSGGGWAGQAFVGIEGWWVRWGGGFWSDGDTDVTAHEIGHNLGCAHDGFGAIEYGNPFAVMGSGPLPEAHFLGAGKHIFNWMDHEEGLVKSISDPMNDLCASSSYCDPVDSYRSPTSISLQPIDDGLTDPGVPMLMRIFTENPSYYYWAEWRTKFSEDDMVPGLMIYFAPIYARQNQPMGGSGKPTGTGYTTGSGFVGASQLLHVFDASTPDEWGYETSSNNGDLAELLADATLPEGETYVVDLDEVGLVITVDAIDPVSRRMDLTYEFTPKGSANYDKDLETEPLSCGMTATADTSTSTGDTAIYKIDLGTATSQTITLSIDTAASACDDIHGCPTLTAYKEFPLNLEINPASDLGVGAIAAHTMTLRTDEDYCANNGMCVTVGWNNLDACDFMFVENTGRGMDITGQAYVSDSMGSYISTIYSGNCADLPAGGDCYAVTTAAGGLYKAVGCPPELNWDFVVNNSNGMATVMNECILPAWDTTASEQPSTCNGDPGEGAQSIEISLGDQTTADGELWNVHSREFYVAVSTLGDQDISFGLTCSVWEDVVTSCHDQNMEMVGASCEACDGPHFSAIAGLNDESTGFFSHYYSAEDKQCVLKRCDWGQNVGGDGSCEGGDVCSAGEAAIVVEVKGSGGCETIVFAGVGPDTNPLTMYRDAYLSQDDTLFQYSTTTTAFGQAFTFTCYSYKQDGVPTASCSMLPYQDFSGGSYMNGLCDNFRGIRTFGEDCGWTNANPNSDGAIADYTGWLAETDSLTCTDEGIVGGSVTVNGEEVEALGEWVDIGGAQVTVQNTFVKCVVVGDCVDVEFSGANVTVKFHGEDGAFHEMKATDGVSGVCVGEPGTTNGDGVPGGDGMTGGGSNSTNTTNGGDGITGGDGDPNDMYGNGSNSTNATNGYDGMPPSEPPSAAPTPSPSEGSTLNPTWMPTQSPTPSLTSLPTQFASTTPSPTVTEDVVNYCNADSECASGEVCEINVFDDAPSRRLGQLSKSLQATFKHQAVIYDEAQKLSVADVRHSGWVLGNSVHHNGVKVAVLVNIQTGDVAKRETGEVLSDLTLDIAQRRIVKSKKGMTLAARVAERKKQKQAAAEDAEASEESGRRRLFGSFFKGECVVFNAP